jgi:hypothetical protein
VKRYNPAVSPPPSEWPALDEQERLLLVERYHVRAKIDLPNVKLHAVMHAIVENQLAESVPAVVETFERLTTEGLDRHDVLHAIGSVLAHHMVQLMNHDVSTADPNAVYFAELRALTAARWRAS